MEEVGVEKRERERNRREREEKEQRSAPPKDDDFSFPLRSLALSFPLSFCPSALRGLPSPVPRETPLACGLGLEGKGRGRERTRE